MGFEVAVHVDLDRAVTDAHHDVVPVPLVPVPMGRKCAPLAPAAQDSVFDAFFRHGQVELLAPGPARGEDRAVLSGASYTVAGKHSARGQFGQLGDVVVGQVGCGEFNEGSRCGGESKDLFCGEDSTVLREGSDFDASARGEGECSFGAASGGREVCAG